MPHIARVLAASWLASVLLSSCVLDWASLRGDGGTEAVDATFEASFADVVGIDAPRDRDASYVDAEAEADIEAGTDDAMDAASDATDAAVDVADASSCAYVVSGTLATFDFTGQPGNQVSTAVTTSASGLVVGNVGRSSVVVAATGANSINSTGWATTSTLDSTRYYTLSITPPSKCALDLTSLTIDSKSSSTGPANGAVATSDDGFVKATTFVPGSSATPSLSVSSATGAVEIRVYGYGASGAAGTFRIQTTLTVSGALK